MKKILPLFILTAVLLSGCAADMPEGERQYTATYLDLFDTVTTIIGRAQSEEAFGETADRIYGELERYHRLFDIYNEYEGLTNLCTLNRAAGKGPVEVGPEIIALLSDCREFYETTGGKVNAAMGSVLSLWHDARSESAEDPERAYVPDESALSEAQEHIPFDAIVINKEAGTVCITDARASIDVGAIAKGWAVQRAAESAPEGLLISVGGNVCATGPKDENGTSWVIGIQDPDGGSGDFLHTISLDRGSVVTSGDYQRAYTADGKTYHHIIDPDTLYPAELWRSVTVVCDDSAAADALSTALFLLPLEEGQALLDRYGAQALWTDKQDNIICTPGFSELIRS